MQTEGSCGGPEWSVALLLGSEGMSSKEASGVRPLSEGLLPTQNLHLWITRAKVWEGAPEASGGLPQMPFWLWRGSCQSCSPTSEQNGGGEQASGERDEE